MKRNKQSIPRNKVAKKKFRASMTNDELHKRSQDILQQQKEPKTKASCSSHVNQFTKFCRDRRHSHPNNVTDETPNNIIAFFAHKFDAEQLSHSTIEGSRCGIRDYYENNLQHEDGWRMSETTDKWIGNPCDSKMVKGYLTAAKKCGHRRGDRVRRAVAMKMEWLNKIYSELNSSTKKTKTERHCMQAANATAHALWVRINELFALRRVHLSLFNTKMIGNVIATHHDISLFFS